MSDDKNDKSNERDPELDDLLDSALEDMTKKAAASAAPPSGELAPGSEAGPNMWSEEFIKEAAAQFESNMAALLGGFSGAPEEKISQDQIAQTFSKMAEAAAQILKPGEGQPAPDAEDDTVVKQKVDEVSAAISQTLQNLNTNSESLQNPFNDQDLANMFGNFSMNDGQEGNMFLPFMQGMMQSLLSKEVLYPSLKDLLDKYPEWLEKNKGVIPQADYDRYNQQKQLMEKVCAELEPEQETDPDDVKNKRFQTVLELMQKMQDLGQPPTDLVGDIAVPPTGFAVPPPENADQSQCNIM